MDECPFRILGLDKHLATEASIAARIQDLLVENHPVSHELSMRLHRARRDSLDILKEHRPAKPAQRMNARRELLDHVEELKVHTRKALESGSLRQHNELHACLKSMGTELASETKNSRMLDPFVSGYYNFVRRLQACVEGGTVPMEDFEAEQTKNKALELEVAQLRRERDDAVGLVERLKIERDEAIDNLKDAATDEEEAMPESKKRRFTKVFSHSADGKVFKQAVSNFVESRIVEASRSFVTTRVIMDAFSAGGNEVPSEAIFFKELRNQLEAKMPGVAIYKKISGARGYDGISILP